MYNTILRTPDYVEIQTENGWKNATQMNETFEISEGSIKFVKNGDLLDIIAVETVKPLCRIRARWNGNFTAIKKVLGDMAGIGYGEFGWMPVVPEKCHMWYLQCFDGAKTYCYGVKTGCNSFCFWQIDPEGISLVSDIRCGGNGVMLKESLLCATIVEYESADCENTFSACKTFCKMMCDNPNLPDRPVFGLNNWYYAYGNISRESVLEDSKIAAELCTHTKHKPYMVIDDGWQLHRKDKYIGGPFVPAKKFGDMQELAAEMDKVGCEPGLWIRPLLTKEKFADELYHPRKVSVFGGLILDPSRDEVLEYISELVSRVAGWGYKLIKYDFTASDMFTTDIYKSDIYATAGITDDGWSFSDNSVTNAQIVKKLYNTIQEAAKGALVMGCNTYNHLAAGIHQIQRSGKDTGGPDWNRTRQMGVNTLAFRLPHNNNFFVADPDCAAITENGINEMNVRFFEACALSGTSTFISVTPNILSTEHKRRLQESFKIADSGSEMEPLDWFDNTCPQDYLANGKKYHFNWYDITNGVNTYK